MNENKELTQNGRISRMVTATILSMSLLTVMAAAAIAPAMGIICRHFASSPDMWVQLIISLPALFIILINLCFLPISRVLRTRAIAIIGLVIYVVAGTGCFFIDNLPAILVMRALLGVSVGLIMPLSTGLLSYFYPPEEQARLMGLSAAMNQMGGVVGTLLAGILASVQWNYSSCSSSFRPTSPSLRAASFIWTRARLPCLWSRSTFWRSSPDWCSAN